MLIRMPIMMSDSEKAPSSAKQPKRDYGKRWNPYEIVEDDVLDMLRERAEKRKAQQKGKTK